MKLIIGIVVAGVVLACSVIAKTTVDDDIIRDIFGLETLLVEQQYKFLPISPPSEKLYIHKLKTPIAVNLKRFPKKLTTQLYAEMEEVGGSLFPVYRIFAYEDPSVFPREVVFQNSLGTEIYRLPIENESYNPYEWQTLHFQLEEDEVLDEWNRWIFDPAHIAVEFVSLIPEIFHADYLAAQEEEAMLEVAMVPMGMAMMSLPATVTNLMMVISPASNSMVELEIGWPAGFDTRLEMFATTNLITRGWQLVYTNIITTGSTNLIWMDSATSNLATRFYSLTDADLDSDSDLLVDGREIYLYETDPQLADTDGDGMRDDYEILYGLDPTNADDAIVDSDGDFIPNVYEYKNGQTDPFDADDFPSPTAVASTNGHGDTFAFVDQAISAASASNDYSIVLIEPGRHIDFNYWGEIELNVDHILIYGTNAATILDCDLYGIAFEIKSGSPIISGLTIVNGYGHSGGGIEVESGAAAPYIVNCVFRNNRCGIFGGALSSKAPSLLVESCTFTGNYSEWDHGAIDGEMDIRNCLIWNNHDEDDDSSQINLDSGTVSYSCIEDGHIGTGNITNNPYLVAGSWRLSTTNSSCFGNGSPPYFPIFDIDGEPRGNRNDIGADQFVDTDDDDLSDWFEISRVPPLNPTLSDTDDDGLSDWEEIFTYHTDPTIPDSDGDGLEDGEEITLGTNPWKSDTDKDGLSDKDEVDTHFTNPLLSDSDGDGVNDYDEIYTYFTQPMVHDSMVDTDGDAILDILELGLGTSPTNSLDPAPGTEIITVTYPSQGQILN